MTGDISFGQWLKRRRQMLGLTQKSLALDAGCAVITLQKIEANVRSPSVSLAEQLAAGLGVSAEDMPTFVAFARGEGGPPHPSSWRRPTVKTSQQRHNVPHILSPLHGRERELALVTGHLRQGRRLVTLLGAPGIGKTRLAVAAAHAVLRDFTDGVYFVPLHAVSDPTMVGPAISQALAPQTVGDRTLPFQLAASLHDRHLLLVLDNFEQVLPAASLVGALLNDSPWLSVLVTSRIPLHLYGEVQVELQPLAAPKDDSPPAALQSYPSAALFIERATAVQSGFVVTEANAPVLAQICRQLDGLPLAIELVAAQIKLLPPEQLLAQLEAHANWPLSLRQQRLSVQRPVTLGAAIAASIDLLTPEERSLLLTLATFVGGFTLDAAEAVAGSGAQTLAHIGELRDKSLLYSWTAPTPEPRFRMLTVVREHVLEVAAAIGNGHTVAQRHAAYFVSLTQKGAPELHGPDQTIWLNRLSLELANCRAAFNWLLDEGDLAQAIQLVVSLGPFYIERSLLDESRQMIARLRQALETTVPPVAPTLQIKLDNMTGSLAYYAADWTAALVGFRQALATARALPSVNTPDVQHEMAYALDGMAAVAAARGEFVQAKRLCTDSLARSRACEDRWLSAITLLTLGEIARSEGDLASRRVF